MEHSKSEKTIVKHNFNYKGIEYKNDYGFSCHYRVIVNGNDTGKRVQYYRGRLLQEYAIVN